jgi:hypothetical protein
MAIPGQIRHARALGQLGQDLGQDLGQSLSRGSNQASCKRVNESSQVYSLAILAPMVLDGIFEGTFAMANVHFLGICNPQ